MTGMEHAFFFFFLLAVFLYVGKWIGKKEKVEDIITHTLDTLEKNNMIKVKKDNNGNKEILPLDKYYEF